MKIEILSQTPQTRCYICNKPNVDKLCHHCARAICTSHNSASIPDETGMENPEFTNLDLDYLQSEKDIIHCKDCLHYVQSHLWMRPRAVKLCVFGLLVGLAGIIFKFWLAILLGLAAIALGIIWYRSINKKHEENYEQKRLKNPPPFPVIPNIRSVVVDEHRTGSISLNSEGKYISQVDKNRGTLTFTLQFAHRDRERLDKYLKKYKLSFSKTIPFHAGFAVLEGAPNLQFENSDIFIENRPNTIAFDETIGEQPFLASEESQRDSNWTNRFVYTVPDHTEIQAKLPVQIIPTLDQEGAQRAIDVVVQLSPTATSSLGSGTTRIEEFVLYAPQRLGKIAMVEPSAVIGIVPPQSEHDEPMQKITWKAIDIRSQAYRERRQRFYIRFDNKIDSSTVLYGNLRISFTGTLSELKNIKFFFPWGKQRPDSVTIQRHTFLDVKFELNLAGLHFQDTASETKQLMRAGVLPNHAIVTQLTEELNNAGVYLKRVIENPARTSKAGAHITNRYWDMAGRYYDGVYPIDFHLVLTGEEAYGKPSESKVQVDVSVQGVVANDDMREKVASLRDRLSAITENTLDNLPAAPADSSPVKEANFSDIELEQTIPSQAGRQKPPQQPIASNEVSRLLEMLAKLDEALIEGRISESRYDEMQKRYKSQLIQLGHTF